MKNKEMRISDTELEMLKSTFADRDELLKTIRNLFYGLPLTEDEKNEIKRTFSGEQLRKLMRKMFIPEIQRDLPISQAVDLWMFTDIKDRSIEQIENIISIQTSTIEMLENALRLLEDIDGIQNNLDGWIKLDGKEKVIGLQARTNFIVHVDKQLQNINTLAGAKTETIQEAKDRLMKNSNK